ncbi:MAG TPA: ABC transporter ATP-binding protein [Candidatus Acidoferrum sp.]|nr:ABC transporter ATP-binding protein [Candidatus Acidoferrum sp.]
MTAAIEFEGVTKVYRRGWGGQEVPALTQVSFAVNSGEVCAFLGPNGAGKTTSISILMGFHAADGGAARVLGYEPGDVRAKRQIGFVPENFAFYKHLNAVKLLRFHAALAGVALGETDARIADLLGKVKLSGYETLKIGKYSRGMVQRLGIAQALLGDPQLLIMDEPTSGLDPAGRKEVRDLILALKAAGKTIFLSSHLLSEVEQICDKAIIINRGRLVREGTMQNLLTTGDKAEVVADRIPPEIAVRLDEWGATTEQMPNGVKILLPLLRKREAVEALWAAGADVVSLQPLKSSLEELYMQVVGSENPS